MSSNRQIKVAFDVDGTLIWPEGMGHVPDSPRYEVLDMFRMFSTLGCQMFIWSGGGVEYAERWRDRLGLAANVVEKGYGDMDIVVDDQDVQLGSVNIIVNYFPVA